MEKQSEEELDASFTSNYERPVKRGRKAAELFQFEVESLKKIAELKEQAKDANLSPHSRRLFRNKASAQQSRLDKKLAYWRLKQQFKELKRNLKELSKSPKRSMARVREIVTKY